MSKRSASTAARSFRIGAISAFDIGLRARGGRPLVKPSSPADDARAIGRDWKRVGDDLRAASDKVAAQKSDADDKEPA